MSSKLHTKLPCILLLPHRLENFLAMRTGQQEPEEVHRVSLPSAFQLVSPLLTCMAGIFCFELGLPQQDHFMPCALCKALADGM